MDVNYFIKKFRSIPQALWTTGSLYNGWTYQCCAMGHCDNTERQSLSMLFCYGPLGMKVSQVNDYPTRRFPQATPKARILAALEQIKTL